ncbi:MAG: CBS domain-containing protein [Thermofilaceae archaeon]|nr:CBS domain-containing protein [Thermofilaceae archaeon]MDW8003819.1 CBS domain-containing protein [Thermofilaceae archaeon]
MATVMELITLDELRTLRKKAGLTQAELARRAGVSQSLIARVEAGTVNPRLSTLTRIYNALREYMEEEVTAEKIMNSPVITAQVDDRLDRIAEVMWMQGISQIPVLDRDGSIVGTVYERDIVEAFLKHKDKANQMKVIDIMSEPLPLVQKTARLNSIVKILRGEIPAVLVVDGWNLIGIITKSDLMRFFAGISKS